MGLPSWTQLSNGNNSSSQATFSLTLCPANYSTAFCSSKLWFYLLSQLELHGYWWSSIPYSGLGHLSLDECLGDRGMQLLCHPFSQKEFLCCLLSNATKKMLRILWFYGYLTSLGKSGTNKSFIFGNKSPNKRPSLLSFKEKNSFWKVIIPILYKGMYWYIYCW